MNVPENVHLLTEAVPRAGPKEMFDRFPAIWPSLEDPPLAPPSEERGIITQEGDVGIRLQGPCLVPALKKSSTAFICSAIASPKLSPNVSSLHKMKRTSCFARLRGAESRPPQRPQPQAALRLPGVRESSPLEDPPLTPP